MTYLGSSALFRFIHLPWPPLSFLLTLVRTAHPRPPCSPSSTLLTLVHPAHPCLHCSPSSTLLLICPAHPHPPCPSSALLSLVHPAHTHPPCSPLSTLLTSAIVTIPIPTHPCSPSLISSALLWPYSSSLALLFHLPYSLSLPSLPNYLFPQTSTFPYDPPFSVLLLRFSTILCTHLYISTLP